MVETPAEATAPEAIASSGWRNCNVTRRSPRTNSKIRIGIDIGGVLVTHKEDWQGDGAWEKTALSEVAGAMEAVAKLVHDFGPYNIFLVSFAKATGRNGGMRRKIEEWLHQTMHICTRTGFLPENIHFTEGKKGVHGKGKTAEQLQLTHFVDDSIMNLRSVYSDRCGNAGDFIHAESGKLVLFPRSGLLHNSGKETIPSESPFLQVKSWADCLSFFNTCA
jgi:hypothetical protein